MKTPMTIFILLLTALGMSGRLTAAELPDCDCPDCREKAEAGETGFTLPGLTELTCDEHDDHDHAEAADHDHDEHAEAVELHDEHADHDHEDEPHDAHVEEEHADHDDDAHVGHDHAAEAGAVDLHDEAAHEIDLQLAEAAGGTVAKTSVFPAEIKLNRDRAASVSPRYASVVRQVFAEIGDEVKKGDVLASLENRETLAVYTVAAPFDGTVIAKDLSVGETADADAVLYEVADLSTVWADISIFPQYQHLIKRDMPVEFIAHDGHATHGRVKYISPIVSHETRTFTARCVLEDAAEDFTPGVFVRARIATEIKEAAVRVERAALQSIEGESVVFVPGDHGYEPAPVETGLADDRFVEILHGLEAGDSYVVSGAFSLKAELITSGMDPHAGHNH